MDKKIKSKWVKALRSGKFRQARGDLQDHCGALCCIGVGAVVIDKKEFNPLIKTTADAAGILGLDGDQRDRLVRFNDDKGWSFERIAAYIDRYL